MSSSFVPFDQERMQSQWENRVRYNLSESGVQPMSMGELVPDPELIENLLSTELNYPQSNGILELRQRVADLYPGATPDNVLITTGCAQANFTTLLTILDRGDEIAVMLPCYMQIPGIARNLGLKVRAFHLREDQNWSLDVEQLQSAVSKKTKLISVVNPNNPSGKILSQEEVQAVLAVAERSGAWILADEVYAGTERLTDEVTPTFWGRYDRVLATNGLSKAYGLPGLRIGWVVAPAEVTARIWAWQDYITIGATMLSNQLAAYALSPDVRARILSRSRQYIRQGYRNLESWMEQNTDLVDLVPPEATAVAFLKYKLEANSVELVHQLIKEDALVVPGDHFGHDHYLRVSFGLPAGTLAEGLSRLRKVLVAPR